MSSKRSTDKKSTKVLTASIENSFLKAVNRALQLLFGTEDCYKKRLTVEEWMVHWHYVGGSNRDEASYSWHLAGVEIIFTDNESENVNLIIRNLANTGIRLATRSVKFEKDGDRSAKVRISRELLAGIYAGLEIDIPIATSLRGDSEPFKELPDIP